MMKTTHMHNSTIDIPPLWEYSWHEAIDENDGESRNLLELCSSQAVLLERCKEWTAAPEAIGWLTLWTRNYQQMQGAISLLQSDPGITNCGQLFTLELIWRSSFELYLQMLAIYGESMPQLSNTQQNSEQVVKNLNAYVAWSIYQDRGYCIKLTNGRRLDSIWDTELAKALKQDPDISKFIKHLWGDEYNSTEENLIKEKKDQREESIRRRNMYMRWLEHPRLSGWFKKIREQQSRDFFGLISSENGSVRKTMDAILTTDSGYPAYQRASAIAHGTSIDAFLTNIAGHLAPSIAVDKDQVQSSAGHVRRFCHFNCSVLSSLLEVVDPHASPDK